MIRPLVLSICLHSVVMSGLIMLWNMPSIPQNRDINPIRIRINPQFFSDDTSITGEMPLPLGSFREKPVAAVLRPKKFVDFSVIPNNPPHKAIFSDVLYVPLRSATETTVLPMNDFDPLDPFADMEDFVPSEIQSKTSQENDWIFSWEGGEERSILKIPHIDSNDLPEDYDYLSNLTVAIWISPEGSVVSAEIEPPGSGDIRIDRYIHGKALDFIFGESLNEDEIQRGVFRLVFEE